MTILTPTAQEVREALQDWIKSSKNITFRPGWNTRGRPWYNGIRGTMVHHWAGVGKGALEWMGQVGTSTYPYCNVALERDGHVTVWSCLSAWHSGTGGPWGRAGVPKDLAHLSVFGIEMEGPLSSTKYGTDDMTDKQWERVARINCAIREVAGPEAFPNFRRVIRHRDWTDGTAGVSKNSLPTVGRKNDVWEDIRPIRQAAKELWDKRAGKA